MNILNLSEIVDDKLYENYYVCDFATGRALFLKGLIPIFSNAEKMIFYKNELLMEILKEKGGGK